MAPNKLDLRAGLAPAFAVYGTAASLPMLAENKNGCRGMTRTCIYGFRDRRPTLDDPAMAES